MTATISAWARTLPWPLVALALLWPSRNVPSQFVHAVMDGQACPTAQDLAHMGWEYHGTAGKEFSSLGGR